MGNPITQCYIKLIYIFQVILERGNTVLQPNKYRFVNVREGAFIGLFCVCDCFGLG